MKIKSAGPIERGAGSGICEGAGGITGISVEEEGGSVEEEGPPVSDGAVEEASDLLPLAWDTQASC